MKLLVIIGCAVGIVCGIIAVSVMGDAISPSECSDSKVFFGDSFADRCSAGKAFHIMGIIVGGIGAVMLLLLVLASIDVVPKMILAIVVLVGALFFFIAMCIDASVADDIGNGANDEKDKYVAGAIFDFFAAAGFGLAGALTLLNKD